MRIAGLWTVTLCATRCCDKGGIYRAQVSLWYHVDVGNSLSSHKSKPQLLKRKWSEDMPRNVRARRKCARKRARKRAKARWRNFGLKLRKLRKQPSAGAIKLRKHFRTHSGHKTAKVTHLSKPYSYLLPPRALNLNELDRMCM